MEDPRTTFAETLRAIARLYGDLIALLEQESDAMVRRDAPAIERLAHSEQRLLEDIRIAERKRLHHLALVGRSIGVNTDGMPLGETAELVGGRFRGEYLKLRKELYDISQKLARQNRLKMLLCRSSLDHIHTVIRLLGGGDEIGTYTPDGMEQSKAGRMLINRQA